jgi:uncharacterized protein YigE (DUF2233 family)
LLVLFILFAALHAHGEPTWVTLAPGVEYKQSWVNGKSAQVMHVLRWNPRRAEIRHLSARAYGAGYLRAAELRHKSGALAVFNGGYFDAAGRPLGLLFAGKWVQKSAAGGSAFGGMFSLIADKPALHPIFQISDGEYDTLRTAPQLRFLLQCGPRLVAGGQLVSGLEKDTFTRRTWVAYDGQNRLLLGATAVAYMPSFPQLQAYLQGQLGVRSAMNLDGGSSTQSSVRGQLENLGFSPIPFALGIFKK